MKAITIFYSGMFLLLAASLLAPRAVAGEERIVSLSPALTEIIYALGAEDRLTGVSRQCDTPLAAKLKPKLGDFNRPHLEKIRAAQGRVVLFSEQVRPGDLELLGAAGIDSQVLPARTVADILAAIRKVGVLTGRGEKGEALASSLEEEIARLQERLPAGRRPRVYMEVDGPQRLYTVGGGSFMSDLVRLAGGENVFGSEPRPYFALEGEDVRRADPEVILIDHPFQYKVGLSRREGWGDISAVRQGNVHDCRDFDMILLNRPGPRIPQAIAMLMTLLHPEASHVPGR